MGYIQAAMAVAGTAYGIIQGERGNSAQRQGLRRQAAAQEEAKAAAFRQDALAQEATNRANSKSPDASALLDRERNSLSSMLTGANGVPYGRLRLGKPSLLGS